jgi:uncharacterized protein
MEWSLVLAGLAMGVASTPHCAVMCGAPCAALTKGGPGAASGFHLARIAGYVSAGAVAASSIAALGAWSQASPALRPFWTMLHLAFLALGLWWVVTGRQPAWMLRRTGSTVPVRIHVGVQPAARATIAGLAWVAWPCAALQGGLLLAALANSAQGGALVMAAFAIGSMPGLAVAPWAWARWRRWQGARRGRATPIAPGQVAVAGFRIAGVGLVAVSGWALTHGIWERIAAWCAG